LPFTEAASRCNSFPHLAAGHSNNNTLITNKRIALKKNVARFGAALTDRVIRAPIDALSVIIQMNLSLIGRQLQSDVNHGRQRAAPFNPLITALPELIRFSPEDFHPAISGANKSAT
jgi:hypothetical protein